MSYVGESSRTLQGRRRSRPLIMYPQFAKRLNKGEKRPLQLERGIDIDALDGTRIPEVVRPRQWLRFVQYPNDTNDKLVREFYASMVPDNFYAWEIVNECYGLPNLPQAPGGMKIHPFSLNSNNHDLFHAHLDLLSAFWHIFCDHSILPNLHRMTLTFPVVAVLFSLQQSLQLIAGIDKFAIRGKTLAPKGLLSRATYNRLTNVRRAPRLSSRRVKQRVDQPQDGSDGFFFFFDYLFSILILMILMFKILRTMFILGLGVSFGGCCFEFVLFCFLFVLCVFSDSEHFLSFIFILCALSV
ncbi:hypothetical protein ACOSQ4_007003 [Xanthoceras sorbifolium]